MKKTMAKKIKKEQPKRYFGLTKVKKGAKMLWKSEENKHGWSLGFVVAGRTVWLRNIRFASQEEALRALESANVDFSSLKRD